MSDPDNLDQHGTTIIGMVLGNKIVVGHDSRSSNKENKIGSDNAGERKAGKLENTPRIAEVVDHAERYMSKELQRKEDSFATLIFGIEEGDVDLEEESDDSLCGDDVVEVDVKVEGEEANVKMERERWSEGPVMYLLKSFNEEDLDLQQNTTRRAERIHTITSIGSGKKFLTNELSNYNVEVKRIGSEDYIANSMLKAALFDPHTGGNIYVLTLNVDGTSNRRSWSVPKLYLEKFEIAKPWDEKSIFIVCVEERLYPAMAIRDHAKFNKWMNSFPIFKAGDIEICHLIGGFNDDLQQSALLYRVVLKTENMVKDFFALASKSKRDKDVIVHAEWKVHPRHVSKVLLQNLLPKREYEN